MLAFNKLNEWQKKASLVIILVFYAVKSLFEQYLESKQEINTFYEYF